MHIKRLLPFLFLLLVPHIFFSYTPLTQTISDVTARTGESIFFIADTQGFITQISKTEQDFYQVSMFAIEKIALHPQNNEIAIYETDGNFFHQVSVWNWQTKTKRFSKKLSDAVTCLSYSSKGNFLLVGTNSVTGMLFFNSKDGNQKTILKENTGHISFAQTSPTESNLILYAPQGVILYYDLKTGKKRAQFETESNLSNVSLYKDNVYIIGVKKKEILKIYATSGKIASSYETNTPIIFSFNSEFAYLKEENKVYTIFPDWQQDSLFDFSLQNAGSIQYGFSTGESIILITKNNDFYILNLEEFVYLYDKSLEHAVQKILPLPVVHYEKIIDFVLLEEYAYVLTENDFYSVDLKNEVLRWLGKSEGYKNIFALENMIVFYTKDTNQILTVYVTTDSVFSRTPMFTPKAHVQNISGQNKNLAILEGNNLVTVYDIAEQKPIFSYKGAGFQDVLLINKDVCIAKSSSTVPAACFILVNMATGETMPLAIKGDFGFSLSNSHDLLSGFVLSMNENVKKIQLFAYSLSEKQSIPLAMFDETNFSISSVIENETIFSTFNELQISKIDLKTTRVTNLMRSNGIPVKLQVNSRDLAALNSNGTVSVYNMFSNQIVQELSIDVDKKTITRAY